MDTDHPIVDQAVDLLTSQNNTYVLDPAARRALSEALRRCRDIDELRLAVTGLVELSYMLEEKLSSARAAQVLIEIAESSIDALEGSEEASRANTREKLEATAALFSRQRDLPSLVQKKEGIRASDLLRGGRTTPVIVR